MIKVNLMDSYKTEYDKYKAAYDINGLNIWSNIKIVLGIVAVPVGVVAAAASGAVGLVALTEDILTENMNFFPWVGILGAYGCYLLAKTGAEIATDEIGKSFNNGANSQIDFR